MEKKLTSIINWIPFIFKLLLELTNKIVIVNFE